jgi:hypothetical protein
MSSQSQSKKTFDWSLVVEVILKILTIGLYHVKKHQQPQNGTAQKNA